MKAPGGQFVESTVEAVLRLPTDLEDRRIDAFLAAREFLADFRWFGVMLAAFDEKPAGVGVAAFGDGTLAALFAAGVLTGHEAQVGPMPFGN